MVKGSSWGSTWRKVEGAQLAFVDCEILQNLLSEDGEVFQELLFGGQKSGDEVGIEEVIAALIYIDCLRESVFETLWFWQRSQDVAPLALWMASTKLVATKRLRLHIAETRCETSLFFIMR